MIIGYSRDGDEVDWKLLESHGFQLNEKDFRRNYTSESYEDTFTSNSKDIYNFVGFLINKDDNLFLVFPKNFDVSNIINDSKNLFSVISRHIQKRPDLYFGSEVDKRFISNYPFSSFFGIYDYYISYGLHIRNQKVISQYEGIKINWKETIRLSRKIIANNHIYLFPFRYENSTNISTFLTECMIFSINHTIEKFESFIKYNRIERISEIFTFENNELVIEKLNNIRQQTFKDNELNLIDDLICFFEKVNIGGSYFLKHYSFASIWEDMVMDYLKWHFQSVSENKLVFGNKRVKEIEFKKQSFNPNQINTNQYITPDYYYTSNGKQYIFDAKYYSFPLGLDYKQISYYLFLCDLRDEVTFSQKFSETYSAIILPSRTRASKIHFQMNPKFNSRYKDMLILEEYLNIREIIEFYVSV